MHTHGKLPWRTFIVTASDRHGIKQIGVTSPCICDINEWVTDNQDYFGMVDPEIVSIHERILEKLR